MPVGEEYTTEEKPFDNYVFTKMSETSAPKDGAVIEGTQEVVYMYRKQYTEHYEFKSGTEGKELPEEVMELLPTRADKYFNNDEVNAEEVKTAEVVVEDGKWIFKDWKESLLVVEGADVKFIGVWVFEPNPVEPEPTPAIEPSPTPMPEIPAVIAIQVEKVWRDSDGNVIEWPEDIPYVALTVMYGTQSQDIKLTSDNQSIVTDSFITEEGAEFSIQEAVIEGYNFSWGFDEELGLVVYNTKEHIEEPVIAPIPTIEPTIEPTPIPTLEPTPLPVIVPRPTPAPTPEVKRVVDTADGTNLWIYVVSFAGSIVVSAIAILLIKKVV